MHVGSWRRIAEKLAPIFGGVYSAFVMNVLTTSGLTREQIAAEIAEMRKAARAIAASPRKQLEFLRRVGVLNGVEKQPHRKRLESKRRN